MKENNILIISKTFSKLIFVLILSIFIEKFYLYSI